MFPGMRLPVLWAEIFRRVLSNGKKGIWWRLVLEFVKVEFQVEVSIELDADMGTLKTYIFCALGLKVEYLMKGKIELQA